MAKYLDSDGLSRLVTKCKSVFALKSHGNHVPTTQTADNSKFLRNDNTWQKVTPANIGAAASSHSHGGTAVALTGYTKPSSTSAVAATDTVNAAIGKLEKALDGKQASGSYAAASHTHNYAGSSSAGGAATSAAKLNTDAGSGTQPVYFSNGVPVATTYSLNKTVPADAKFTDTTYTTFVKSGSGAAAGLVPAPSTTAGTTKYLREDGTWQVPPDTNTTVGSGIVLTGYTKPSSTSAVAATDTVNAAIGKLEKTLDGKQAAGTYLTANSSLNAAKLTGTVPANCYTNTTYAAGDGIALSGTTFSNNGVRAVASGGTNGTIKVNTGGTEAEVAVAGLGSAAYTASTAYAASGHNHDSAYAAKSHTHDYVPTTRTVNGKALSADISLSASDVGALSSHQTIKQDGVTGATANRFGTCSTAAGTAAKTVSITSGTFNLEAGARVSVKFSNANTAGTPTLNVNSKGAKNIFHKGAQITTGDNKALLAGVCDFIYDGTQWHLVGNFIDTNTTYTAGDGVSLSSNKFTNSGVRSIATGSTNGTISVNTGGTSAEVAVKGLGTAAYTASSAYAAASHGNHVPATQTADNAKFLRCDNSWATVTPANIGAAAASHTHDGYVPTSRTVNGKALSANISLSASDVGAAASSHTHSYAGSSSAGGAATSANKVNNSLVLKFKTGTTEGTDLYTFNGSAAKTVDIKAGSNVSITSAAGVITIAATDTKYSASTGLSLTSGAFSVKTASASQFGGVTLSDSSSSTSGAADGIAATPAAVKAVLDKLAGLSFAVNADGSVTVSLS